MARTSQTFTLFLAGWQKRMIQDFLGTSAAKRKAIGKYTRVTIRGIDRGQLVMYRQPLDALEAGTFDLYLTDEQINIVAAKTKVGVDVSALNITPALLKSGAIVFE